MNFELLLKTSKYPALLISERKRLYERENAINVKKEVQKMQINAKTVFNRASKSLHFGPKDGQ